VPFGPPEGYPANIWFLFRLDIHNPMVNVVEAVEGKADMYARGANWSMII
jgi:hypothetical protein